MLNLIIAFIIGFTVGWIARSEQVFEKNCGTDSFVTALRKQVRQKKD